MKIVVVCVSNPTLGATFRGYSDSSPTLGATGERSGAKLFRAKKGLRGLLHGVRLFKGFDDGSGPAWVIGMETVEMVKCWLSRQGRYSDGRSAYYSSNDFGTLCIILHSYATKLRSLRFYQCSKTLSATLAVCVCWRFHLRVRHLV
jgi:hypothetical protein